MSYRSGTYIAFHAAGNNIPGGKSDIDYYNLLCAWDSNKNHDFKIVNSHEKASAVRDSSKKTTLRASLLERLRNSRNMVLIIGETARFDTDWVPFEVETAIDGYRIPIIVAYTVFSNAIRNPRALSGYWPPALKSRIDNRTASAVHVPFKQAPLYAAIDQFSHDNLPNGGGLGIYDDPSYLLWGIP